MPWCRAVRGLVARPSLCTRTLCVVRRSPRGSSGYAYTHRTGWIRPACVQQCRLAWLPTSKILRPRGSGSSSPTTVRQPAAAREHVPARSLRSCSRRLRFLFCTRVAPPQACASARAHAAACHRPESARGDLSKGAGGANIFFHFGGKGNQNVQALAQGQAVTYTAGVHNGRPIAENVAPSSGGSSSADGAPKGAAAFGGGAAATFGGGAVWGGGQEAAASGSSIFGGGGGATFGGGASAAGATCGGGSAFGGGGGGSVVAGASAFGGGGGGGEQATFGGHVSSSAFGGQASAFGNTVSAFGSTASAFGPASSALPSSAVLMSVSVRVRVPVSVSVSVYVSECVCVSVSVSVCQCV
jgi:cold shock CspA family protein